MSDLPYAGEVFVAEDGTRSTVLEDTVDPNYQPSQEELEEYATWIGIDMENEPDLLWIAKEGLRTPLPSEWKPCKTDTGEMYYFNFETGDSVWDHPLDEIFRDKVENERTALASGKKSSQPGKNAGILKKGSGISAANENSATAKGKTALLAAKKKKDVAGAGGVVGAGAGGLTGGSLLRSGGLSDLPPPKPMGRASLLSDVQAQQQLSGILPGRDYAKELAEQRLGKLGAAAAANAANKNETKTAHQVAEDNEKKLQDQLKSEFDLVFKAAELEHDKKVQEKEQQLKKMKEEISRDTADDVLQVVNAAKRKAEQSARTDLQEFEEELEKRETDLRKKLRALQVELEEESSSNQKRESQLLSERRRLENDQAQALLNKRQEIQKQWFAEKTEVENKISNEVREIQQKSSREISALKDSVENASTARLKDMDKQLLEQLRAARTAAQKKKEEARAKLASSSSSSAGNNASSKDQEQLLQAEEERSKKSRQVQEQSDAKLAKARLDAESRISDAQRAYDSAISANSAQQQSEQEAARQKQLAQARNRADEIVAEARRRNSDRLSSESRKIDEDTQQQIRDAEVQAKRRGEEIASGNKNREEETARQMYQDKENEIRREHKRRMEELRSSFDSSTSTLRHKLSSLEENNNNNRGSADSLENVRRSLESKFQAKLASAKSEWLSSHPPPQAPVASAITTISDEEEIDENGAAENESSFHLSPNNTQQQKTSNATKKAFAATKHYKVDETKNAEIIRDAVARAEQIENQKLDDFLASLRYKLETERDRAISEFDSQQCSRRDKAIQDMEDEWRRRYDTARNDAERIHSVNREIQIQQQQSHHQQNKNNNNSSGGAAILSQTSLDRLANERRRLSQMLADKTSQLSFIHASTQQQQQQHARNPASGFNSQLNTPIRHSSTQQQPQPHHLPVAPLQHQYFDPASLSTPLHQPQPQFPLPFAPVTTSTTTTAMMAANNQQQQQQQQVDLQALANARTLVQQRKAEIKSRQSDLEAARTEWKRDMAQARSERDENLVRMLLVARGALEERARVLNEDALAVKKAASLVKQTEHEILYGGLVLPPMTSATANAQFFAATASNSRAPSPVAGGQANNTKGQNNNYYFSASSSARNSPSNHHHHHHNQQSSAMKGSSSAAKKSHQNPSNNIRKDSSTTDKWSNWLHEQEEETSTRRPLETQVQKVVEWLEKTA